MEIPEIRRMAEQSLKELPSHHREAFLAQGVLFLLERNRLAVDHLRSNKGSVADRVANFLEGSTKYPWHHGN
jgi:hypothetical protein